MAAHSKYSPSGAHRWLQCPGSLTLPQEDSASDAAEEGTEAHALLEKCLASRVRALSSAVGDMGWAVNHAYDYCLPYLRSKKWACWIEHRMESTTLADFGGTLDFHAVQVTGTEAVVVDYKNGTGVNVVAEKNSQLLCYAALLIEEHPHIENVKLVIIQPHTKKEPDEWYVSRQEIDAFREQVAAAQQQTHFCAGEHCRWCPAQMHCEEIKTAAIAAAQTAFDDTPDEQQVDDLLKLHRLAPAIRELLDSVQERLLNHCRAGGTVPGLKPVYGYGRRRWIHDPETTIKKLQRRGIGKKQSCRHTLKPLTELEREGHAEQIADLLHKPLGALTLAPLGDRREAVEFRSAEEVFEAAPNIEDLL